MPLRTALFLAGDSWPSDDRVETQLRRRLAGHFADWVGQQAILDRTSAGAFRPDVAERLRLLAPLVAGNERDVVLIGRSSGARVASLLALRQPVGKLVCLGYPFRVPNRVLDAGRFQHLAGITVPTLLIQGAEDRYGGLELTELYPLSSMITLAFVAGEHEFAVSPDVWDRIAGLIIDHCNGTGAAGSRFDEIFYLRANPDVAEAVARGIFPSGAAHYRAHGRREGRSYRLLPPDGPPG